MESCSAISSSDSTEFTADALSGSGNICAGSSNEPDARSTSVAGELVFTARTAHTFPKICRNREQFAAWQKSRPWLTVDEESGNVRCLFCCDVKRLGLHNKRGQHNETAFIDGAIACNSAKTLFKKIDKHRDSQAHMKCAEILQEKQANRIVLAVQEADAKFAEHYKTSIDVTSRVFRTVYECVKSHLPCSEHPRLIALQSLNGLDCGKVLYSNHSCSNIASHIADCMRTDLIHYILNSQSKFSLLIDESTSVSNVQSIIVYIRILFDGEICTYFLGLLPLSNATAAGIE
jgi:hypothetical protein